VSWAAGHFRAFTGASQSTGQVFGYNSGQRTDLIFGNEPTMDYGYVNGVKPGFALVEDSGDVVAIAAPPGAYTLTGSWIFEPVSPGVEVEYGVTLVDDLGSTDPYSATATFTTTTTSAGFANEPFDINGDGTLVMWARTTNSGDTMQVIGIFLRINYEAGGWHTGHHGWTA
jgi:hypothetical protein